MAHKKIDPVRGAYLRKVSSISEEHGWDGGKVIELFLDVLTDCNFHSERKAIENALEEHDKND